MCFSLLGILACGIANILSDPEPYKKPTTAYVAPTNCNADGVPSDDGFVCHPK